MLSTELGLILGKLALDSTSFGATLIGFRRLRTLFLDSTECWLHSARLEPGSSKITPVSAKFGPLGSTKFGPTGSTKFGPTSTKLGPGSTSVWPRLTSFGLDFTNWGLGSVSFGLESKTCAGFVRICASEPGLGQTCLVPDVRLGVLHRRATGRLKLCTRRGGEKWPTRTRQDSRAGSSEQILCRARPSWPPLRRDCCPASSSY